MSVDALHAPRPWAPPLEAAEDLGAGERERGWQRWDGAKPGRLQTHAHGRA